MPKNPVLDLPLTAVMRSEIALPLQQILNIPTVGCLLDAWQDPQAQKDIEEVFESPGQARHAVSVCATWAGYQVAPVHPSGSTEWWS